MRAYLHTDVSQAMIEAKIFDAAGRFSTREGRWPNRAYVSIVDATKEFLVQAAFGQIFCTPVPWLAGGAILVILEGENSHG